MAAMALASAMITAIVALGAISAGRLPADGSIGMVCALVLAAVAAVEASRPARVNRVNRRLARSQAGRDGLSDADEY